jgi:hypothetical protein
VISAKGELHRARLILEDRISSSHYVVDHFELCSTETGRSAYWIDLPPGHYDLSLSAEGYEYEFVSGITLEGNEIKIQSFALTVAESSRLAVVLLPLLFLAGIGLIRWHIVAKPTRLDVMLSIRYIEGRFPGGSQGLNGLRLAQEELERWSVLERLFWSGAHEMASWKLVHGAELALLEEAPPEKIDVRLASAEQLLSDIGKSSAKSLAHRVSAELKRQGSKINKEARRQLLIEATGYIFDASEADFAASMSSQSKAFWMSLVGIGVIEMLGYLEGHVSLLLAGAIGGFLSHLIRESRHAETPTENRASWSVLFLSPIVGALCGWVGVALIMFLSSPDVGVLGGPAKVINWDSGNVGAVLAAAFVLGFSERLFLRLVTQAEGFISKETEVSKGEVSR